MVVGDNQTNGRRTTGNADDAFDMLDNRGLLEGISSSKELSLRGSYAPEYEKKLIETYNVFKGNEWELSEHSLNKILGRIDQGKIGSINEVLEALKNGTKYIDTVNGGTVMFKDGISVHIADDGTIKTVIGKAKIKDTWEVVK